MPDAVHARGQANPQAVRRPSAAVTLKIGCRVIPAVTRLSRRAKGYAAKGIPDGAPVSPLDIGIAGTGAATAPRLIMRSHIRGDAAPSWGCGSFLTLSVLPESPGRDT